MQIYTYGSISDCLVGDTGTGRSDDHAYQAIGAYGSRLMPTPNIDRIAREGALFTRAMVTNSICGPSRATLLTGKYSHKNGYKLNEKRFDPDQPIFPALLQEHGYQTAWIGKWHLGSLPSLPRGFDYFRILNGQGQYYNPDLIGPADTTRVEGHSGIYNRFTPEQKKAFYNYYENKVSREFDERHDTGAALLHWKYERYLKDYLSVARSLDRNIGLLLNYLDAKGLASNTVVIYASDQGFYLGEHGWFDKRWIYEESLRTPFLMRYPGVIKPGSAESLS